MQSENACNYYVHNDLPTLTTYLLIFLFCPRTFYQFWIQDLTPAVLALKLSVILSKTKPKHKMIQYSKVDCFGAIKKKKAETFVTYSYGTSNRFPITSPQLLNQCLEFIILKKPKAFSVYFMLLTDLIKSKKKKQSCNEW